MTAIAPFAWIVPAVIGIVLAAWITRDRESGGWNWWRAAAAGPLATAIVFGVWGLARAFNYLAGGKGPLGWVGVTRTVATDKAPLVDGVLRLGLGAGLLFAIALVLLAKLRSPQPRRMPLALVGLALGALCGLVLGGVFASDPLAFAAAMPVDLVAFIPVGAAGIALSFAPLRAPIAVASVEVPAPDAQASVLRAKGPATKLPAIKASAVDGEGLLRQTKLVAEPTFAVDPQAADAGTGSLDRVWAMLGGAGPAPASLVTILERVGTDATGTMLVDLPPASEDALVTTLLVAATLERASRALVICDEPKVLRDRVAACLDDLGVAHPGPLLVGDGEVRDALAHNVVPALVCLDAHDVAGSLLAARTQRGVSWLRHVELLVLIGADRRQPIAASHLAFALRRLALALEHQRARTAWVALGASSPGSQRFIEESTMRAFERVPHGAKARSAARIFVRPARGEEGATPELDARAKALGTTGLAIARSGIGEEPDGYRGDVSMLVLEDRHLAPLFLARNNLVHRVGAAKGHLGLWWVDDTPLSRFLLRDGALVGLEQRGEIQAPRPVAGLDNIYLASSHLEAALHDGTADELGLRRAFGDRAVDQLLSASTAPTTSGARARWNPTARTIERSRVLAPTGTRTSDPRRETVSASMLEVKGSRQGEVLLRVDRRVAPTRFYPHRVFRASGALYQVGGDPVSDSFVVKPAPVGAMPTLPQLALEIADVKWQEPPKQVQIGKVAFARGIVEVNLRESVSGVISRDKGNVTVKYSPITVEYPTRATVVMFAEKPSTSALSYAGAMIQRLVPAQLQVEPDDVGVVVLPAGIGQLSRPALVFVDRHLGGLGVSDALDASTIHDLFRWTWGILYRCKCMNGCDQCTPPDILQAGQPDKVGALKLLGG